MMTPHPLALSRAPPVSDITLASAREPGNGRAGREARGSFAHEAHVYRLALGRRPARSSLRLLSRDELERAACLQLEQERRSFLSRRLALRLLLARYLNVAPEDIEFVRGESGKPSLRNSVLQFSLGHCPTLALIAVSHAAVGVDVEPLRADLDPLRLARRFLSAEQAQHIAALSGAAQRRAFFEAWTRREAYVKAVGCGLLAEAAPRRPLRELETPEHPNEWTSLTLDLGRSHAGALVVSGPLCRVQFRNLRARMLFDR